MSRSDVTMREVLLADMYEEKIDRLTAEVEKWKSIAQQINTDWIPANQALAEEVERLKELVCSTTLQRNEYFGKLSRYEQGVEVEGIIGQDAFGWTTFIFDEKHRKLEGQRVKVLVMKEEV